MRYLFSLLVATILLTSCGDQKLNEKISENNLSAKVEYGDKIVNKTIFESDYKMIVFAMRKDQDLKPHSASMEAPMLMLEGSAKVTIGDETTIVEKGDIITLPKNIVHGVYPITDCKFLLIK
ncbi:MAG TPA: hypothetical protein DEG69_02360 [Flavobacteriaceae bacterium]|jgi:quercetin dioxygenase-like cupin family protein|nr:hypothetical protein [Flavobacteriaceae bacterium]|tara:strand:- start:183752 stop:184117 length:366 start_codon:yes stop_codon:yes gene_type:complete